MKKKFLKSYSFNVVLNTMVVSVIPIGFIVAASTFEFYNFILSSTSQTDSIIIFQNINWLFKTQFKILIIATFLSIIVSFLVAKRFVKPIIQFTKLVSSIKENSLFDDSDDSKILTIEERGPSEIQELARTINTLISTIFNYKKASEFFKKENTIDSLTKIHNKKYFLERISMVFSQENHNLCVLFLDIDKFKHVNDTYGHLVGDKILKEVAKIIKSTVDACGFKLNGTVARYGGEEITILLEDTDKDKGYALGEQIRLNIYNSEELHAIIKDYYLSISIGVANSPSDAVTIEELLIRADSALYYSKENGRNKCTLYNSDLIKDK